MDSRHLARLDRRAAQMGQGRSEYIRNVLLENLEGKTPNDHVFASKALLGICNTGIRKGDNQTVRRIIQSRLRDKA
jgi:hypothetical protein